MKIWPYNLTPDRATVTYEVFEKKGDQVIAKYTRNVDLFFSMNLPRSGAKFYDFVVLDYRYI
jgi:hypothetical protein